MKFYILYQYETLEFFTFTVIMFDDWFNIADV
jgi:hypothetical protein